MVQESKLALIYAKRAKDQLIKFSNKFDGEQIEIKEVLTKGDEIQIKDYRIWVVKGYFQKILKKNY